MNARIHLACRACAALWISLAAARGQDYLPAPAPASFARDSNTTFLADLTAARSTADYALGDNQLSLEAGSVGMSTRGNWPAQAWTVELLLRVPYLSGIAAGQKPIGLAEWESGAAGCKYELSLTSFGVTSKLQSWNQPENFLSLPYAGGNGFTVQTSAPDKWVYVAAGCDFAKHLHLASAREMNGAILNSNMCFMPCANNLSNSPAAWQAMEDCFGRGLPAHVTWGNALVELRAIKISNCFRSNIFNIAPLLPQAGSHVWTPSELDPARVATQSAIRDVGYQAGYQNYRPMTVTETYLELLPGSPPITLTLTNVPIGLYSFMIYGQIAPRNRTSLNQVWNPCPMDFAASDGHGGWLAHGEMLLKQAFRPRLMQGFHFHVDRPGNVAATFSLPARAMETVWIQQIRLADALAGLPDVAVKSSQNFFPGGPSARDSVLTAAREKRDDLIWNSLPPLNTPLQADPINNSFQHPPSGVRADSWVTAALAGTDATAWLQPNFTFSPLDFLDTNTGAVFSQSNILAWPARALPGANPDYGWGSFFNSGGGAYYAQRAQLLGFRYLLFAGAIVNSQGSMFGLNLGDKYYAGGDPETGHDAAMALVRFAYDWPALQMNLHDVRQCTQSPDLDYHKDWSYARNRNGKMTQTASSGSQVHWLFNTYDQLFPYIQNNQTFAAAVHRHVPWVNTPADVIRLLDRFLVFASVMQATNGSQEIDPAANIELLAGRELGPSPYSADLFNLTDNEDTVYPLSGTDQELYGTALSRSGIYYIASFMCYGVEGAQQLIEEASLIQNAEARGLRPAMNLADVAKYPKVRGAGDFLLDMWVAGGFPFMVGDSSGGPHTGLQASNVLKAAGTTLLEAFNLDADPRLAWELRHTAAISNNPSINAAASVQDPILYASNRVVPDFGAILEMEPNESDVLRKTSATLRLGVGQGHAHYDYLDLNLFALGLPLSVNLACRSEGANYWSRPPASWSFLQNHALGHPDENPAAAGAQFGEPWLRAFAPPLVRASYLDPRPQGGFRLERDTILMRVGDTETYYAFDLQRLSGNTYHTWCFHGCESSNLALNVPMRSVTSNRWIGRMLENTRLAGPSSNVLQATWTMTRSGQNIPYTINGGGTVRTVACEPAVLGALYNPALPPVHLRATLLGRGGDTVLQGEPYSAQYQYCFPFLWVQSSNEPVSVYPAVYEWYRGDVPVVAEARVVQNNPFQARVTTTSGQVDTYEFTTNYCLAVSRDAGGPRWLKLSGSTPIALPDLTLSPSPDYVVTIKAIDYQKRALSTSGPLPNNPAVIAGNDGRRVFLQLSGSGTSFAWADDLLVQEGRITDLHVTGSNSISIASDQPVLFDGWGNRSSASMTVSTEDGLWNFRGGKVIKRPAGAPLTPAVFSDANGDGRIDMKTYEIGVGDQIMVPADITCRRDALGWLIRSNVALSGAIRGSNSVSFNLPPSGDWQRVTIKAPHSPAPSYAKSPVL